MCANTGISACSAQGECAQRWGLSHPALRCISLGFFENMFKTESYCCAKKQPRELPEVFGCVLCIWVCLHLTLSALMKWRLLTTLEEEANKQKEHELSSGLIERV